jgi:hypothetical protein
MPAKTFDCVEMKRRAEKRLLEEYEAHRDEYPSFAAFVRDRARNSEAVQDLRRRLGFG